MGEIAFLGGGDDGGGRGDVRCRVPGWRPGAAACLRVKRGRARARLRRVAGLPSVSVPVLSMTSVSTLSRLSRASALRISTPAAAPRPVPTMMDIGVARPSAQGQAMISTATAVTQRVRRSGAAAQRRPSRRRRAGGEDHRGNEIGGDAIGQALDRRAAALGFADHARRFAPAWFRCRRARRASRSCRCR